MVCFVNSKCAFAICRYGVVVIFLCHWVVPGQIHRMAVARITTFYIVMFYMIFYCNSIYNCAATTGECRITKNGLTKERYMCFNVEEETSRFMRLLLNKEIS